MSPNDLRKSMKKEEEEARSILRYLNIEKPSRRDLVSQLAQLGSARANPG
jgi:hypothetical protein